MPGAHGNAAGSALTLDPPAGADAARTLNFVLATAGHVDHGKSSLVRALTGTDPDRLPEEKARQITIDLGFAHAQLRSGDTLLDIGVVDVPGHEDFVRNMIAGVGAIDAALLVVAADDGWMPQTEEHLQILEYLGITRGVVALTKADLCADAAAAVRPVQDQLRGTPLESAPIVPVSTVSGDGISELRHAIAAILSHAPPPRDIAKPRLSVDRAFSVAGIGTVVTGTLADGTVERGQAVHVHPLGGEARIRSIQSHGRELDRAHPGTRIALGLPALKVSQRPEPGAIRRGDVLAAPGLGRASDTAEVALFLSGRATGAHGALRHGSELWVHHGSDCTRARLCLASSAPEPGASVAAQLRFERPVFLFAGDRLVVRDASQRWTLAGGAVLDPCAPRRGFRARARAHRPDAGLRIDATAMLRAAIAGPRWCNRHGLLEQSRLSADEAARAIDGLISHGEWVQTAGIVADRCWWEDLRARACAAVDALHQSHPERAGLDLRELRRALEPELTGRGADAMVADLCRDGFFRTASVIRRADHRPRLPARLQAAGDRLRAALSTARCNPPSRSPRSPDPVCEQALKFLIINAEAVELSPQVVLGAQAYTAAAAAVAAHLAAHGHATVSQLGAALAAPRRIMVPLLERLDREGITRRRGDVRESGAASPAPPAASEAPAH